MRKIKKIFDALLKRWKREIFIHAEIVKAFVLSILSDQKINYIKV